VRNAVLDVIYYIRHRRDPARQTKLAERMLPQLQPAQQLPPSRLIEVGAFNRVAASNRH
jgi:hypothetical protein